MPGRRMSCPRGHKLSQPCSHVKGGCRYCDKEDHAAERKRQRDLKLELERQKKQEQYAKQLAEAQEEIARLRNIQSDHLRDAERERILKQHQEEIESLQTPAKSSEFPSQPETVTSAKNAAPQGSSAATVNTQPDPGSTNVPNVAPKKEPTRTTSAAQNDWEYQKKFMNAQVSEVDRLMQMIGLESVKEKFLSIKANVDVAVRQGVDLNKNRYGTILLGNPGTGKTTVARLYASFLKSVGIIPGEKFIETSGSKLTNDGVSGCRKMLEEIQQSGGGVLFIDEAYQLVQGGSYGGSAVLDFLLTEVENLTGKVGFIIAGYQRQMEAFLAHNPGLPSRFPHKMKFQDMEDEELRQVLAHRVETTYRQKMKVEEGLDGLYCRIVARRIGRGRGREGFANARAVENAVVKITERQSVRLKKERRLSKAKVDDFLLTKEDLIGPEPSAAVKNSKAWKDLQSLIGLSTVKETIEVLLKTISFNYQRELNELPPVEYTLNKVFLGSPGTGKTTIAKLYGQILVDLGMLSNGEVVVRNPSDFVGDVVGASEKKTKGILASTQGKVLVIDEAYGLFASNKTHGTGGWRDPFRTAVVDTLVAEVQSTPGEDRCVLLLGYKDLMQQMFQDVNPGLSRRFPLDQAFTFEDFTREELDEILIMKVKQQGFVLTDRGRRVALEAVERARNRPNFGNAGEIDILLNAAKTRQQGRLAATNPADSLANTLDAADFDKDFDRADQDGSTIKKLFEGVVGCDDIVSQLERYYRTVKNCRQFGLDPRGKVPFNFLFRGPPGTGKTSTARKMGLVYYNMGLLASTEVVECSATDLIGQYIGHAGPKTEATLEKGLGKVLFIDEAYRLADGQFAKEAMDEIVDCITKPKFAQRLIIILAGYDADINHLMAANPGLTSRFPGSLQFNSLSADDSVYLLTKLLSDERKALRESSRTNFDLSCLETPSTSFYDDMKARFDTLSQTANWANGRDVGTLATTIFGESLEQANGRSIVLSQKAILGALESMLNERSHRGMTPSLNQFPKQNPAKIMESTQNAGRPITSLAKGASQKKFTVEQESSENTDTEPSMDTAEGPSSDIRDAGVSDYIWEQLQRDKDAADAQEKEYLSLKQSEQIQAETLQNITMMEQGDAEELKDDEAKRRHEQTRIQNEIERRRQEEILEELRKKREKLAEERRKEHEAQKKLREMGVCCQGFRWIKQAGGYRCAGGSHWLSDTQLGQV